ncbi:MAG: Xylose operon regulatory protein [Verrucomicrobiota bacterium]|jgi:LacI family transcriptional regulator
METEIISIPHAGSESHIELRSQSNVLRELAVAFFATGDAQRTFAREPFPTVFSSPTPAVDSSVKSSANMSNLHVAVLIDDTGSYARDLLSGIAKHQRECRVPWSLHIVRRRRFEAPPPCLRSWDGHGIIARVDSPEVERELRETGLPVVNVSGSLKQSIFPTFVQEPMLAARLALQCFEERGFRNFAYVGDSMQEWSLERARHFESILIERGNGCARLLLHPDDSGADRAVRIIRQWLGSQPRPLAVWVGDDAMGVQVLNACLQDNVKVPEEVAVLSVDNDTSFTELTTPPLSSVILNGEGAGYLAAKTLEEWMRGKPPQPGYRVTLPPLGIAFRRSTDVMAVDDPHVALALKIIQQEACMGLRVAELVGRVPLARRRLECKFRTALNRTLLEEIWRVQCHLARELLETTDLPMMEVAERCGYEHVEHFGKVFKKVMGCSPGKYRNGGNLSVRREIIIRRNPSSL